MSHFFKKTDRKIKKIVKKNEDFLMWTLIFLSADYLFLFWIETVLPSYVMSNLNINLLLIFVLIGWLIFSNYSNMKNPFSERLKKIFRIFLVVFLVIVTWFVLYNIIFWEFLVIIIILLLIGFHFLKD